MHLPNREHKWKENHNSSLFAGQPHHVVVRRPLLTELHNSDAACTDDLAGHAILVLGSADGPADAAWQPSSVKNDILGTWYYYPATRRVSVEGGMNPMDVETPFLGSKGHSQPQYSAKDVPRINLAQAGPLTKALVVRNINERDIPGIQGQLFVDQGCVTITRVGECGFLTGCQTARQGKALLHAEPLNELLVGCLRAARS